jgi:Cof subfamily protein (haloacid dehalogenase superfamily)
LVLDLDGTTLRGDGALDARDVEAARRLREAGVDVTINTGRLFPGTHWVAEALGVRGTFAVMNGCEILDMTGACVDAHHLDVELLGSTREIFQARRLPAFLFASRSVHLAHAEARHLDYLTTWSPHVTRHEDVFSSPAWSGGHDVLAVGTVGERVQIEALKHYLDGVLPPHVGTLTFDTFDGERFLQVTCTNRDKGTALRRLADVRGVALCDTVAIGDWWNDEPMLRDAGLAFAMSHATEPLKRLADEVLDAGRDGGAVEEVARKVWGV